MSALSQIAKDPSCLLAVDALQGGRWLSTLRPDTPRNFAEKSMKWTDFQTVQEALDPTHDYTFEIEFECTTQEDARIFYISATGSLFGLYHFSSGLVIFTTCLLGRTDIGRMYTEVVLNQAGSFLSGKHTAKMVLRGNTATVYMDDLLISTVNSENISRITPSNLSTPTSGAGYVYCIRLVDDTTGTVAWQAAYSDLYDMSKSWPSDVPSNFAEKEKLFYDYQAILSEQLDPTHDYSFFMDTEIVSDKSDCPMFYIGGADGVFGLYCYSNNTIRFTTNLLRSATNPNDKYASMLVYQGDARPAGRHSFEGRIEGNIIKTFFDNQPAFTSAVAVRTNTKTVGCNRCNSGYVYKIQIKDLTTGKTVWRYPTWEERVQLLTKANVRTDHGVFEAADENTTAGVDTQLDLRGNATSKTFIVRAFCPAHDPASEKLYIHPFFGQGQIAGRATDWTFQFALWEDRRSGKTSQLVPAISDGTNISGAHITGIDRYLNQWHTYAMVVDYLNGNCYFKVFVDGTMLNERGISRAPAWNTPAATTAQETTVGIRRDPNVSYYTDSLTKVSSALVFDRALTASEIAALSYAVV